MVNRRSIDAVFALVVDADDARGRGAGIVTVERASGSRRSAGATSRRALAAVLCGGLLALTPIVSANPQSESSAAYGAPPVDHFPDCPSSSANLIHGTSAGNSIIGTPRADRIIAGIGRDTVDGRAGDDCIDLGPGADRGRGGLGGDLMLGGPGADRISGSAGNDRLRGGPDRDRINGGPGRDRIDGDSGGDRINGSSGNDRLTGGSGRDVIAGGSGNDRIDARDGQRDRISCGPGVDRVLVDLIDRFSRDCGRLRPLPIRPPLSLSRVQTSLE